MTSRPLWLALLGWYALSTAYASARFVTTDVSLFDPLFQEKYAANLGLVIAHGGSAIAVLVLGFVLFLVNPGVYPSIHRLGGHLYATLLVIAGVTGFRMALMAYGGLPAALGLGALAILWIWTLWQGIAAARRRQIAEHRRWMIRNYGLTFAAVVLRVLVRKASEYDLPYEQVYPVVTWLSWVPTLVGIELWFRRAAIREWIAERYSIVKVSPRFGMTTFTSLK